MIKRKKTKVIKIGPLKIGGDFPIIVESMTNTQTRDVKKTVKQIKELEKAGCELIRVGVPDLKSARAISEIKKQINIPLIADIHFSPGLALESIKQGADKIRINPGNFPKENLGDIVKSAQKRKIPIRVGINSGSIEKDILGKYKRVTAEMMAKSALRNVKLLEKLGFYDLVISAKAPDVLRTIRASEIISKKVDYPLHLGITEAGAGLPAITKSAIGIGLLLFKGIGNTIRVSLSAHPVEEVKLGWEILKSLGLREKGVKIISCPTCARTSIDVFGLTKKVEQLTKKTEKSLKVAVMGCVVNGLGEGREADLAIVGLGNNLALLMKDGETLKKVKEKNVFQEFKKEFLKLPIGRRR